MKIPRVNGKHTPILILVLALLICFQAGMAVAAGGGDGGHKGWVATDTYRVMNFTVLAVGLFLLLRKPVERSGGTPHLLTNT
jgi:F-type H+-transporting ATPase subunit b